MSSFDESTSIGRYAVSTDLRETEWLHGYVNNMEVDEHTHTHISSSSGTPSLSLRSTLSFYLYLCMPLCHCLSFSVPPSLSLTVSLSLCFSLSIYFSVSLSLLPLSKLSVYLFTMHTSKTVCHFGHPTSIDARKAMRFRS